MPSDNPIRGNVTRIGNIRAVFNKAIDDGKTDFYPFRAFKIKHEDTRKRALTAEQLAWILNVTPAPGYEEARDIFMLLFYLIGINLADLLAAKKTSVKTDTSTTGAPRPDGYIR